MTIANEISVPHYCRYEGQLKVKHTALPTPHTSIADYYRYRDLVQLKAQRNALQK